MKYIDEFRDPETARRYLDALHAAVTRPWTVMEVCGGQTHAIVRFGLQALLPKEITLVHGPGCPVCVTPVEEIDRAIEIAAMPDVVFCSFGDMLRVPGSRQDLLSVKAAGGDLRIVYSPLDAVTLAAENPDREVVFFAVGFETTAPANAMAVWQAAQRGLKNFSVLVSHVLVPPAMRALLDSPQNRVQGFLAAGHVCAVMGWRQDYAPLARHYGVPVVVTGFEPVDILQGLHMCVTQLEQGRACVENQYARAVPPEGNAQARALLDTMFVVCDRNWRGIGVIPDSGYALSDAYRAFDAASRFGVTHMQQAADDPECLSGQVLQGLKKPQECPAFGTRCTPEKPLGATMVSGEGACAAYFRYAGPDGFSVCGSSKNSV